MKTTINIKDLDRITLKHSVEPVYTAEEAGRLRVEPGEYSVWLDLEHWEPGHYEVLTLNGTRAQFERMAASIIATLQKIDRLYAEDEAKVAAAMANA